MKGILTFLFGAFCMVTMITTFNACSDDLPITNGGDMNKLYGTWEVIESSDKPWHGYELWDPYPIITFTKRGLVGANNGFPPYLVSGNYKVEGNVVKIFADGNPDEDGKPRTIMEIVKINDNEMECILSGGSPISSLSGLKMKFIKQK